jgi:long-chain acyl-CoA synthetase
MKGVTEEKTGSIDCFNASTSTIPQMFYHAVQNAGSKPANIFKSGKEWNTVSYKEWAAISEEIAMALIRYGVKKGDDIALLSRLNAQRGWADMAILITGAVSAAITPTVSDQELQFIMNRSDIKFLFAENAAVANRVVCLWDQMPSLKGIVCLEERFTGNQAGIWGLDEFRDEGRDYALQPSELASCWQRLHPEDRARMDYTKSTTGKVKYRQIKHGEWEKTEWCRQHKILTDIRQGNQYNIYTTIMALPTVEDRVTGFFSQVARGALIKYGSGPSPINRLQELKAMRL